MSHGDSMGNLGSPWNPTSAMVKLVGNDVFPWIYHGDHGVPGYTMGIPWKTMDHHGIPMGRVVKSMGTMFSHGFVNSTMGSPICTMGNSRKAMERHEIPWSHQRNGWKPWELMSLHGSVIETMGSQMNAIAVPWKTMGSLQRNNKIHFNWWVVMDLPCGVPWDPMCTPWRFHRKPFATMTQFRVWRIHDNVFNCFALFFTMYAYLQRDNGEPSDSMCEWWIVYVKWDPS